MLVHDILFGGSYEERYFKKVIIKVDGYNYEDDTEDLVEREYEIDHEAYCWALGQSSVPQTEVDGYETNRYLENFEGTELEKEKEKLEQWLELGKFEAYRFNVDKNKVITIEVT